MPGDQLSCRAHGAICAIYGGAPASDITRKFGQTGDLCRDVERVKRHAHCLVTDRIFETNCIQNLFNRRRYSTDWFIECSAVDADARSPSTVYTLRNDVGFCARQATVLSNHVAERYVSVAGLVKIR